MPTSTTKSNVKLTGPQKKLSKLGFKVLKNAPVVQAGVVNPPPGGSASYIAPTTAEQTAGQNQVLGAAAPGGGLANASANASKMLNFLSGDVLSPESNPYLKEYGNYLQGDLGNQFATSVLPNIRTGAGQAGQFGSSRQGIAEGLASEGLSRQTGGALSDLYSKGYGQGLDAFTKGLSLAPSVGSLSLAPGLATSGVGDVRQAANQAQLSANQGDYYLQQLSPLAIGQSLIGSSGALPGGGTVTSSTYPGPTSAGTGLTALGGASTGAGLGASLAPLLGMSGAGGSGIGAGLGALLAFL